MAEMDVARLNFSHGTQEDHRKVIDTVRELSTQYQIWPGILGDLQGFKIRTAPFPKGSRIVIKEQQSFILSATLGPATQERVSVGFSELPRMVEPQTAIFIRDGLIELLVERVEGDDIHCRVIHGGTLKGRDGMNVPELSMASSTLTEKDISDIRFAVENKVDLLAVSFVRNAEDLKRVAAAVAEFEGNDCKLIAKIETREAVRNINEILEHCHGIMIARGDLGVELRPEKVPAIQKEFIRLCNRKRKLVITATQMLESMTENPRPTRAEASDVANAVFDGSDGLLLSGETAAGKFPTQTLITMKRIVKEAEIALEKTRGLPFEEKYEMKYEYPDAICHSASYAADHLKATAIAVLSRTGYTGFLISKYHPRVPILGITSHRETAQKLSFYRGVVPALGRRVSSLEEIKTLVDDTIKKVGLARTGDTIVIISGTPEKNRDIEGRSSNMMMIHKVE